MHVYENSIFVFDGNTYFLVLKTLSLYHYPMGISFDKDRLESLLKDFHVLTGLRLSVFGRSFELIVEYPAEVSPYCKLIRAKENGIEGCRKCDHEACQRAGKMKKAHTYICHAGLLEGITPIKLGDRIAGFLILGQMKQEGGEASLKEMISRAKGYGVPEEASLTALSKMKPISDEKMRAAIDIMDAIASHLYTSELAVLTDDGLVFAIESYVRNNLSSKLTTASIADRFAVSRSYLYKLSLTHFGCGMNEYIRRLRVGAADALLKEGKSIAEASSKLGFVDQAYFIKTYKAVKGKTPHAQMKALEEREASEAFEQE